MDRENAVERPEVTESSDYLSSFTINNSLKQEKTLPHAGSTMLLRYLGEDISDRRLRLEERLVDQAVQALPVIEGLDLGKDSFDGVEFRAVADVVDRHNIKAVVVRLDGL